MSAGSPEPGSGEVAGRTPRPLPQRVESAAGESDPGERGRTTIADRVIEKIAGRAALDIEYAGGLRRSVAGYAVGKPVVRADADVDGQMASLRLELAVEYPAPTRSITRQVRAHVTEKVTTLCALTVDHVDITVAVLRRPEEDKRRVQ